MILKRTTPQYIMGRRFMKESSGRCSVRELRGSNYFKKIGRNYQ
jgi:hypothetical protein